jgi:hypothetical protein
MLLKFLPVVAVLALVIGVVSGLFMFRARAMRAFAARRGFQYHGPSSPKWGFPSLPKVTPTLPASFHLIGYPADEIRQIWNVVDGQQSGVSLLVFDSVIGKGKGTYATFIACQSSQNPFGSDTFTHRILRLGEWTALYRIPVLHVIPWTMGIKRLDYYVKQVG